ncbi:endonuclease NucS [Gardnerella sp. DNF00502]|uniref:endonuclease NucS n=1 Tax=unclassified Gardnerella TaxID=2628112 RepID=UPI000C9EDC4C|nr:endonuclease NucS [Gardnerella sp. KA00735]PNP89428.1 endonuclease [Gardnerella sp. KA00735]
MRIIVADCSAEYSGRLNASLPAAKRVLLIKADGSVLIFSELGSYKPLNWMAAPCTTRVEHVAQGMRSNNNNVENDRNNMKEISGAGVSGALVSEGEISGDVVNGVGVNEYRVSGDVVNDSSYKVKGDEDDLRISENLYDDCNFCDGDVLKVAAKKGKDLLTIILHHVYDDQSHDLGEDPGLIKDGVEDHLQRYLAEQIERIGKGASLIRREYPTAIGPVDIMAVDADGVHVAIEIKRHGGIDGVEQLTRYCELLNRDPLLKPVRGVFAAQTITPQARVLAQDRGFTCLILDYDDMRDTKSNELRLF